MNDIDPIDGIFIFPNPVMGNPVSFPIQMDYWMPSYFITDQRKTKIEKLIKTWEN